MTKKLTSAQQIAELQRKNRELEAQLASTLHFAKIGIADANRQKTMGSAVVVSLHYLGGREVCKPFALRDGFSDELIQAFNSDLQYSFALATSLTV